METDTLTRGERTRLSILEAAQELFSENGYGNTSMRQIAGRAGGIAVGGIYNHFGSKQDILTELIRLRSPLSEMLAALKEATGDTGPELLAGVLKRMAAVAARRVDFLQLAYIDLQTFDGAAMTGMLREFIPLVLDFGQRVSEAGGLRPDVNPVVMMRTFGSIIVGFALTERIGFADGQPKVDSLPDIPQEEWLDAIVSIFLHGVAAEG